MTDFPGLRGGLALLSTLGEGSPAVDVMAVANSNAGSSTGAFPANQAIYVPFLNPALYTAYQMAWVNAATISGNADVGIYDSQGNRLVSAGSTAVAGASATQVVDIADTVIPPGLIYLAMAADNATSSFATPATTAPALQAVGVRAQNAAFPLPATATFGVPSSGRCPLVIASVIPVL